MITAKQIFLRDEPLAAYWNGVAKGDNFPKVLAMVRAELTRDSSLTPEMLKGVEKFEQILSTIGERDENESNFPTSGIQHNLDVPRKTQSATTKIPDKKSDK